MKLPSLVLLAALVAGPVAAAQNETANVSDGEIAKYKTSSEAECRAGAAGKGDAKDIEAFCGCIFAALDKSMSPREWQQAYFYSTKNEAERVRQVLAPHLQKADCRPQSAAAPTAPNAPGAPDADQQPAEPSQPRQGQGLRPPAR